MADQTGLKNLYYTQVLKWCRNHDWGSRAYIHNDQLCGIVEATSEGNIYKTFRLEPGVFSTIKAWAGY